METHLFQISASRSLSTSPFRENPIPKSQILFCTMFNQRNESRRKTHGISKNGSVPSYNLNRVGSGLIGDIQRCKSNLGSLFCYDKPIPEEIIEKPVGLSLSKKNIGYNLRCMDCEEKGAVLCKTCSGSGLYVDSILESQGIIVKVRCLGCGGTGNIMCSECGGRGHL